MSSLNSYLLNDPTTTELYTLSLHDALPIWAAGGIDVARFFTVFAIMLLAGKFAGEDRKSTRLNSSHSSISYAVFCLKKKKAEIHKAPTVREQRQKENGRDQAPHVIHQGKPT